MQKKVVALVVVVALAAGAGFAWVQVRWTVLYRMQLEETVRALGRFPSADQLVALKDNLKAAAPRAHLPPDGLTFDVVLEERAVGGDTARFWFVDVTAHDGPSRALSFNEHRVESNVQLLEAQEKLEAAGIKIKRL